MNTTIRKIICLLLSFSLMFSLTLYGFAINITPEHSHHEGNFEPEYIACPQGGKHLMRGIGYVPCYNGSSSAGPADFYGFGTQCTKCYLVLVTEFPANVSTCTKWGTYVTSSYSAPVAQYTVIFNATYSYSDSINGHFEQGFEFIITA